MNPNSVFFRASPGGTPGARATSDERVESPVEMGARLEFLARAGELLSASLDWRTVLQQLAELVVPALADWCAVDVLSDDGHVERVAAAHREREKVSLIHELSRLQPPDLVSPGSLSEVLRTGRPVVMEVVTEDTLPLLVRRAEQVDVMRRLGIHSGVVMPLQGRGRVLGAVSLVRGEEGASITASDLELVRELTRRASLSMDNALLYAEAREAQARTERLQAVTAALSRAATAKEVADVLMNEGLRATGACRGAVAEMNDEGRLHVLGSFGHSEDAARAFEGRRTGHFPVLRQAMERREAQWFSSLEDFLSVAGLPRYMLETQGLGARAILPLMTERGMRGFVALTWSVARVFPVVERRFLEALVYQGAQALERAALYGTLRERGERLHSALQVGKEAEERLFFLLEASRALAEHLDDVEWTLEHVSRVAASSVASLCLVELAGPDGALRCVAASHQDSGRNALVLSALEHEGTLPLSRECYETGEPRYLPDVGVSLRGELAMNPGHRTLLEMLGPGTLLVVPVRTRGRTLGVITLGTSAPQRPLAMADVSMMEELARRVAVALENASLYRAAQAAVRLRDEFLSVASHELKTPLTSLKLQHGLIERVLGPDSREKVAPRLATAVRQVQRLTTLVDHLLDVSRVSLGRMALEPTELDLGQAVRDAVERMEEVFTLAGCKVQLHLPGPLLGRWDALRLDQVLVNLLTNAAKYGAGRPVQVEAAGALEGMVRLSVRDEGIGISEEDLPRLFGRFERAVSDRHYGGLGLGLYISRQIVEAMGGRIEVESRQGLGSIFTVHLPRGTDVAR
ncbi:GAF domain-containing protein [Myxococcus sp. K15C18031901]|uniref:sensor histidine kinase n=1 Tax=Myxococcus dinghuensis TaxID=2906761 RepID=UPI0020A7F89D|nr:GAF domain-containing protein [Myxococcus dinghuensis]MCP3100924.1 GAF domain-containing protein [Myxococcus dinghuensis]